MSGNAPVVTVDGPGGSGKGTVSQVLKNRLGWHLLDSGAIYRVLAVAAAHRGIASDDAERLAELGEHLDVVFELDADGAPAVILDGEDVTAEIRTETCGNMASRVAAVARARQALLARQRAFRQAPGLVADGRDMGTVVFPDAEVKVFLTATVEERARRRYNQLKQQGLDVNLSNLLQEIAERDRRDASRSVAPLKPAEGAEVIDTTGMSVEEVVDRVMALIHRRIPSSKHQKSV